AFIRESRETPKDQAPLINGATVTPEYFHLLRIPLLQGRSFTESDDDKKPLVVVINEAMAKTFWANANPIGDRMKLPIPGDPPSSSWYTVIGVVADARTESLAEASNPQFYFCAYQRRPRDLAIFVRGRLDPAIASARLRVEVQSIDPELPVFSSQ